MHNEDVTFNDHLNSDDLLEAAREVTFDDSHDSLCHMKQKAWS